MADMETVAAGLKEATEKKDFGKAHDLVRANAAELEKKLGATGIAAVLKSATNDRTLASLVDGAEFGVRPLDKSLARLELLISFKVGVFVICEAWGVGTVVRVDYFYRRITVDFRQKKGHQFTYAAAADMLRIPSTDHVLVTREADPAAIETLLKEKPAEFIKLVLKSYGDMPVVRLEDVCVGNGFVKQVNWKKFWDGARVELRRDKLVEIPVKRADPIRLLKAAEDYGDTWVMAFVKETDPKLILAAVREYVDEGKFKTADEKTREAIGERLAFAVTAARNVDNALYAQLACTVQTLGFLTPPAEKMRGYLWERRRFVKAAAALPSREVGNMIEFLGVTREDRARLYAQLPELCYAAVCAIVEKFGDDEIEVAGADGVAVKAYPCREAIGALMREPKAPATLTVILAGRWKAYAGWVGEKGLPPFITILNHAIALGEGRQAGETLKMQNIIRRLFADKKWLAEVFTWLSPEERALFFERFQASIAWDPSTHHAIVVRMTKEAPELESHVVKVEKKKEYARVTSYRSFALKKQEYLKLINVDMPENVRKIEFAKGFGDLSENAEYQYAKDEQRALMQKQTLMQEDLETVKPDDFASATTDEVMPGVTVTVATDAGEKTYVILGEWDNDLERGVISSKTRLAQNMLGKKVGEQFELPGAEGAATFGRVAAIAPLSAEIREWMKLPEGLQI